MSQYACNIVENSIYNPTLRMYIDLGEYRYGVTLAGAGKPLVCLHGFSESGYTWDGIVVPGYQLIRIDTIGHGDSDIPEDETAFSIPTMLNDLHTVISAVAGESYSLMGYSMGARIALLYALEYSSVIENLILESGSFGIESDVERQARKAADEQLALAIEDNDGEWFAAKWADISIFESQHQLSPVVQDKLFQRRAHNSPYALAATLRGSGQGVMPYVGHRLQELSMPSLYISGALDTKYTTIGEELFSNVPNCEHVIVNGAGHNVHLEKPGPFMTALADFLYKER